MGIKLASSSNGCYVPLVSIIKGLCMLPTKQACVACFDMVVTKTLTGFPKCHQHIDFYNGGGVPVRWELKFLNVLDINLTFLSANIIHNIYIYTKICAIFRHNNKQRMLNLLHVSAFLGHLQGGIQPRKIHKCLIFYILIVNFNIFCLIKSAFVGEKNFNISA
jgi:hypothetical protein